MVILNKLRTFYHPERFQGWGKTRNYFEGWYFKLIDQAEGHAFAIIPGIAYNRLGEGQAFVQILNGKSRESWYFKFPPGSFTASADSFEVMIAQNHFCHRSVSLEIDDFKAHLDFDGVVGWPSSILSPGIMGPYAFAPFMECYHGVVSMDHAVNGFICKGESKVHFSGGRGYIEKDWGRSFPSAYIWMQSNHFGQTGISFKASVAKIPWMRSAFVGFIAGLWTGEELLQFTTYNGSELVKNVITVYHADVVIQSPKYLLEVLAHRDEATELASPILGAMDGRIEESMTSKVDVRVTERKTGRVIFEDTGRNTAMEVAGDVEELVSL